MSDSASLPSPSRSATASHAASGAAPPSSDGAARPASGEADRWLADAERVRETIGGPGVIDRERLRTMSGMEVFEAIRRGELPTPPIGHLLGFMAIDFEPGRFVFQGVPRWDHYNPLGSVHGGYAATLLDSCVGCAIHTMLPAGTGYTTLELKVNYLRAMTEKTGPVRAEGKVLSVGRQTGVAEGRLTDSHGKLLAYASTTCLVFPI